MSSAEHQPVTASELDELETQLAQAADTLALLADDEADVTQAPAWLPATDA